MSIGSRLRDARIKLGFSQDYVAQRVDVHRTTIGKYENDISMPSAEILIKLIEIYCEDANYILYGKTKKIINIIDVPENVVKTIYFLIAKNKLNNLINHLTHVHSMVRINWVQ